MPTRRPTVDATWIDVSVGIRDGMVHWPNNPPIVVERTSSIADGARSNNSRLSTGVHTGTHVPDEVAAGRRDDVDEPAQKGDGLHDEVGPAVGPRSLELVRDASVGGPREALLRERGPRAVPAQPFERGAIVRGDDDARVQRRTPRARGRPMPRLAPLLVHGVRGLRGLR